MIIKPLVRSNMCLNAHPFGCAKDVERQINYILSKKKQKIYLIKNQKLLLY